MKQEIPEYAKQRIDRLQRENAELLAKVDLDKDYDPLLVQAAEAIRLLNLATDPKQSTPLDQVRVSGSKSRPMPGQNVRGAKNAERVFRAQLESALKRLHVVSENGWRNPREPEPQRRCRNRDCVALDKRVPKYVGPRSSRIEMVWCQVCNNKLGEA